MKKILVAIDGYSSCGKSTMAKELARRIAYLYCDSGAMYRAAALYCLRNGLVTGEGEIDADRLREKIGELNVSFVADQTAGRQQTLLNGEDVEREIRSLPVSKLVSKVAALDFVREAMVAQQRALGRARGLVMDGRDIGTTVFPDAELKIFVTASAQVRAQRRYDELTAKGETACYDEILENVKERDYIDEHRQVSPLRRADDALLLDNGNLTRDQQNEWLYQAYLKAAAQ